MRRISNDQETTLEFNGIKLDEDAFVAKYENQQIPMTPKEFSLLSLFLKNPNKVFSRDHLMSSIWSFSSDTDDRTIDSHIRNIRDKFRKFGFPIDQYLKTVWGVGYKWNTEE
jgi:DNA-binding response OmpR family regulator